MGQAADDDDDDNDADGDAVDWTIGDYVTSDPRSTQPSIPPG